MGSGPILPAMALREVCADIWVVDHQQKIPVGFVMPARMIVVRLSAGDLWLCSPGPIDDPTAEELAALGPVRYLVGPNRFHHLYLPAAVERFPDAEVLGAPGLAEKRKDVAFSGTLGIASSWGSDLISIPIDGMPGIGEVAFCHRPSGSLLVADLLFNLRQRQGLIASAYCRLTGVHRRVAMSRMFRFAIRDRAACAASCLRLLGSPFDRLVPCHGDVVEEDAKRQVEAALAWIFDGLETPPEPAPAGAPVPEV